MHKRKMLFGEYDTARDGLWTLAAWSFPEPEYQSNFVDVPGGLPLDLSTALTDGEPIFGNRTLTATLESSEGTRLEREARITDMVNRLNGQRLNIVLPDDVVPAEVEGEPDGCTHYVVGRLSVRKEYSDPAHCQVVVTAICEPWRYYAEETAATLTASTTAQTGTMTNTGRRPVVPTLTVTGSGASVNFAAGAVSVTLAAGAYRLPELQLPAYGSLQYTYSGSGTLAITYREAVL